MAYRSRPKDVNSVDELETGDFVTVRYEDADGVVHGVSGNVKEDYPENNGTRTLIASKHIAPKFEYNTIIGPNGTLYSRVLPDGAFDKSGQVVGFGHVEDECRKPGCWNEQRDGGGFSGRFCSTGCELKYEHVQADAEDARREEQRRRGVPDRDLPERDGPPY